MNAPINATWVTRTYEVISVSKKTGQLDADITRVNTNTDSVSPQVWQAAIKWVNTSGALPCDPSAKYSFTVLDNVLDVTKVGPCTYQFTVPKFQTDFTYSPGSPDAFWVVKYNLKTLSSAYSRSLSNPSLTDILKLTSPPVIKPEPDFLEDKMSRFYTLFSSDPNGLPLAKKYSASPEYSGTCSQVVDAANKYRISRQQLSLLLDKAVTDYAAFENTAGLKQANTYVRLLQVVGQIIQLVEFTPLPAAPSVDPSLSQNILAAQALINFVTGLWNSAMSAQSTGGTYVPYLEVLTKLWQIKTLAFPDIQLDKYPKGSVAMQVAGILMNLYSLFDELKTLALLDKVNLDIYAQDGMAYQKQLDITATKLNNVKLLMADCPTLQVKISGLNTNLGEQSSVTKNIP
jgi:hypothetical protein